MKPTSDPKRQGKNVLKSEKRERDKGLRHTHKEKTCLVEGQQQAAQVERFDHPVPSQVRIIVPTGSSVPGGTHLRAKMEKLHGH